MQRRSCRKLWILLLPAHRWSPTGHEGLSFSKFRYLYNCHDTYPDYFSRILLVCTKLCLLAVMPPFRFRDLSRDLHLKGCHPVPSLIRRRPSTPSFSRDRRCWHWSLPLFQQLWSFVSTPLVVHEIQKFNKTFWISPSWAVLWHVRVLDIIS